MQCCRTPCLPISQGRGKQAGHVTSWPSLENSNRVLGPVEKCFGIRAERIPVRKAGNC